MKGHAVFSKTLRQRCHDAPGIRFKFTTDDEIISPPDNKTFPLHAGLHLFCELLIENIMQENITEYGRNHRTLYKALHKPPCGVPVSGYVTSLPSIMPAFSHLPINRRRPPSLTRRLTISRRRPRLILSNRPVTSALMIQPILLVRHFSRSSCKALCWLCPFRNAWENS